MQSNWIRRDAILSLLALLLVAGYIAIAGGNFPLDDAWIHQTYARNLAELGEWSFVPGEPSAASTSPLYTVLLSLGYQLGVPFRLWTHSLGAVALAVTALMAARLAHMVTRSERAAWGTGLALLATWHLVWAASSGMETMIFSMFTLVLIWLAWRELDEDRVQAVPNLVGRGAVLGAVTALATLARPEGALLGGIAALLMLLVRPQGTLKAVIVYGGGAALAFAVLLAPYLALNLELTGGLLPDTASAKFEQFEVLLAQPYGSRLLAQFSAILVGGQILLVPGIIFYIVYYARRENALRGLYWSLPLIWCLALPLLYAARLPVTFQHGRYAMPALPALIVVGCAGVTMLLTAQRKGQLWRLASRTFVASTVAVYAAFLVVGANAYRTDVAIINGEMVATAFWIRDNLPEDELLAIHDIGVVGYFAPRPDLLDIAGLVSPEVIPIVNDDEALWALMEQSGARYLVGFPSQLPGENPDDPRLCRLFDTGLTLTQSFGRGNMAVYRLAYNSDCST